MTDLLKKADICVKCGLCLPYCPTYNKTQNENDSPRGRIALIQGWATGQLNGSIAEYIDRCLLCRECERVCPALVPYSQIIDEFRAENPKKINLSSRLLTQVIAHSSVAETALNLYQNTPLKPIARALNLPSLFGLKAVDRLLTEVHAPESLEDYYKVDSAQGTVALFIGCLGKLLDIETIKDAIKILTHIGFNVAIPNQQTCCGALAAHSGDKQKAEQFAKINQQKFIDYEVIISIASGCGSQLQETLTHKTLDISQFLATYSFNFKALNTTICLHTPCSLRNVMRTANAPSILLKKIPELNIMHLSNKIACCGSAGSYMLEQPDMAEVLLNDILTELEQINAQYLVTSNIGCMLHIKAGIQQRGLNVEVLHPVSLLARQLI